MFLAAGFREIQQSLCAPGISISGLGASARPPILRGMSSPTGEQVLVVKRSLFEEIGAFHGFQSVGLESAVARLLAPDAHFFLDRAAAEEDPSHKQLIPYCVFRCGNRILHYTRGKSGGESRLHAKLSVGVGGHVNPVDMEEGKTGAAAYHAAVAREIEEELELPEHPPHRIIGMINDDTNPVGQVHLGIVHLVELPAESVTAREDALAELGFSDLADLAGPLFERLESWSQFCVSHLAGSKA